jgi:hypothetical protein
MLHNFTHSRFILKQMKSISFIVFLITFALIFLNSRVNIIPLNILIFLGSIVLFHYYPNYYKIVNNKDPNRLPLLIGYDVIVHYIPLAYIMYAKVYKNTEISYPLCFIIVAVYVLLFHSDIEDIYFKYNQYFS